MSHPAVEVVELRIDGAGERRVGRKLGFQRSLVVVAREAQPVVEHEHAEIPVRTDRVDSSRPKAGAPKPEDCLPSCRRTRPVRRRSSQASIPRSHSTAAKSRSGCPSGLPPGVPRRIRCLRRRRRRRPARTRAPGRNTTTAHGLDGARVVTPVGRPPRSRRRRSRGRTIISAMPHPAASTPRLLDKERTIAAPGFNRWLVPPAALAIHLSIGMAYGFSVFWLPLARAIGIHEPATCADAGIPRPRHVHALRLAGLDARLDLHLVLRAARLVRGALRPLARARRAAQGGLRRGALLVRRPLHLGFRRPCPPDLADLARLRRHRRHRPRPRLYLARIDAHQVVSGPARHGDGTRHHGFRRRRDDRRAARGPAHEFLRRPGVRRRLADLRRHGSALPGLHDAGCLWLSPAAARLAACRLRAARERQSPDDRASRARQRGDSHAAVLAAVGRALPQRQRGHRRDRHGLADAAGSLRRQADRRAGGACGPRRG